ncbi:hypothetical protein Q765_00205 [Flavobacterium rivuli WB 3.3-2 = DSM 21788]|uniref:DUF6046 domain-containing protein n=1 Tax=Flavobacterium rivuli WB 3.3-2 = DSM 21788 TaxID=1121895 RepID=A0A0A2MA87_9FLAO|nr:DUF6046 domain-containing protein [Flavobacterium rivuli]KGO88378.1 hypothetical protein Q765_00205 [Flavobacterium rivuli WB 3.3-2 = DSM 21788]
MALNNQQILYASLLGSGIVKSLPRFEVIQNELQKHVLPGLPLFPVQPQANNVQKGQAIEPFATNQAPAPIPEDKQFFPLSFSLTENGEKFLLPYETMINIGGKNILVRRNVAKWKDVPGVAEIEGTVKERFSRDDYTIEITGVLIGSLLTGSLADCYPINDFIKLKEYLTAAKALYVWCEPLQLTGINRIAVEDFSWPFTKGENVQAYTIKAYSDKSFNLILT